MGGKGGSSASGVRSILSIWCKMVTFLFAASWAQEMKGVNVIVRHLIH